MTQTNQFKTFVFIFAVAAELAACAPAQKPVAATAAAAKPDSTTPIAYDKLARSEFNFRAQQRFLPLFWRSDANGNGALDPQELAVLWWPSTLDRAQLVDKRGFTPRFIELYNALLAAPKPSDARQTLVHEELRGGRPTLLETDLTTASDEERQMVSHVMHAALTIEKIHARQLGVDGVGAKIAKDDEASRTLFFRNQGPHCATPQLEKNEACAAIASPGPHRSGLYPLEIQSDAKFCDRLRKEPNGKQLMDHFSVVVADGKGFRAAPYTEAYKSEMESVATDLESAAAAIKSTTEAPLKDYLLAASKAFRTNDWIPADEAWAKMGGSSSKWYLRIAPDEVYYEPCAEKAGFHVSFARINPDSKRWQALLEPVKGEMERTMATLGGAPYRARDVKFQLPDFIDIVLNAGDARDSHGGTIGQSLPNWGPVAARGGRTVAMTNLYTDADSKETLMSQMSSLFCAHTMTRATTDPKPATMSTVLHEAAHNLGPSHDYAVAGKKAPEIFGGPLASTLEELKAQTSALYFAGWLAKKNLIKKSDAEDAAVRDAAWAFGHISRGMYDAAGKPKNYSQLASIQMGTLNKSGALAWKSDEKAGNGKDDGCFEIDFAKWNDTVEKLEKRVVGIKSRGDKKDAEALKAEMVDAKDAWAQLREKITERWLRAPKATFVYSVK